MTQTQKTGSGTLFLCPATQRVMLSLRAPHKTHSMQWSVWGGMHEGNETPRQCLEREIQEEMGTIPKIDRFYPFDIYESKDTHFKFYTFVCIVEKEFIPILNDENIGYSWIKLGLWPKPMHDGARKSFCNNKAFEKLTLICDQHKDDNQDI